MSTPPLPQDVLDAFHATTGFMPDDEGQALYEAAAWWSTPVEFLFLDGNHVEEMAQHDYAAFAPHVSVGGLLAVHDVFPDPADGGQAPWHVVERALGDGFEQVSQTGSLRILRRR